MMTVINDRPNNLCQCISIIPAYVQIPLHLLERPNHHGLKGEKFIGALLEPILDSVLLILERIFEYLNIIKPLAELAGELIEHLGDSILLSRYPLHHLGLCLEN